MHIRLLNTDSRRDVNQFVEFSFQLYRNCPHWAPPLRGESAGILNKRTHPFYRHSDADFFVVEQNGRTLGRMAMLENRNYNAYRQTRTAFFGYFDVVEDDEAAALLLQTAKEWAKARGLADIIGPRGVIGIDGSVLVDGFAHRAALTIPYNYPYYDRLIQASGFRKLTDLLSGYLPGDYLLPQRLKRVAEKVKRRGGFWVKRFASKRELKQWIPRILQVHREAFSQTRSFYPPTPAEVQRIIDTVMTIADPRLIKLVMKGDQIVGFIFAYHDVTEALQKINGRLWPFGWIHVLRARRTTEWLNINGVGMLPSHQGLGGNVLLYTEIEKTVHESGQFKHIDVIQVDEQNFKSVSDMGSIGVQWYKRHRHYQYSLVAGS